MKINPQFLWLGPTGRKGFHQIPLNIYERLFLIFDFISLLTKDQSCSKDHTLSSTVLITWATVINTPWALSWFWPDGQSHEKASQEGGGGGLGSFVVIHLQFPVEKCVGCHHYACTVSDKLKACLRNYWVGIYRNIHPCLQILNTVV